MLGCLWNFHYWFLSVFPNALSIVLSQTQIILYINLSRRFPAIGRREFSSTIGIETTTSEETKKEETPIKIDEENDNKGKEKPVKIYNN